MWKSTHSTIPFTSQFRENKSNLWRQKVDRSIQNPGQYTRHVVSAYLKVMTKIFKLRLLLPTVISFLRSQYRYIINFLVYQNLGTFASSSFNKIPWLNIVMKTISKTSKSYFKTKQSCKT